MSSTVNGKSGFSNIMFLLKFAEEDLGGSGRGHGKQLDVKQIIGIGVCSVHKSWALVQPIRTALPF